MESLPIRSCIFFGAPVFAASVLSDLIRNQDTLRIEIAGVVTPPAKPVGRKKVLTPCAVEEVAHKEGISVWHSYDQLPQSFDLAIVYAFGQILPNSVLDQAVHGFWNIHPSLLPAYRGAAPMVMPLALGDQVTGVTIIQMDAQLDHGPILAQQRYLLDSMQTRYDLETELSSCASGMIHDLIKRKQAGDSIKCHDQDHERATATRILTRTDGYLQLELIRAAICAERVPSDQLPALIHEFATQFQPELIKLDRHSAASVVWNCYRGLIGWPGIWTTVQIKGQERRLKLIGVKPEYSHHDNLSSDSSPDMADATDSHVSRIQITTAQLEGKQPTPLTTIKQAHPEIIPQLGISETD